VIERIGQSADEAFDEAESPERTLKSIATMLGWMNVPPRETLEREINALKKRAEGPSDPRFVMVPDRDRGGRGYVIVDRLTKMVIATAHEEGSVRALVGAANGLRVPSDPEHEKWKSIAELLVKTIDHIMHGYKELAAFIEDDEPTSADHIPSLVSVLKFKLREARPLPSDLKERK